MENHVLKMKCGCIEGVETEGYRKLRNKKRHDLYFSPHVVTVSKSERIRKAGHVAC